MTLTTTNTAIAVFDPNIQSQGWSLGASKSFIYSPKLRK